MTKATHIPALDSLRALAVLAVLAGHADYFFFGKTLDVFRGGSMGVDLFFVLSGFLITRILLREQHETDRIDLLRFYRNRALRLLPALFLLLAGLFPMLWLLNIRDGNTLLPALGAIVFYVYNWVVYVSLENIPGTGHLWSLSVEEQFYLFWPLLLIALPRLVSRKSERWILGCGMVFIAVAAVRAEAWLGGDSWLLLYLRTDLRIDALLAGALLAFLERSGRLPTRRLSRCAIPALGLFLLVILCCHHESGSMYLGGYSAVAALCAVLVAAVVAGGFGAGWSWSNGIGRMSYGIYLYHMPLFTAFSSSAAGRFVSEPWMALALAWSATFTLAFLSHRLIEAPFLARKR